MRTCLVATLLARRLGISDEQVGDAYFTALLRHLGCTAYSHEAAWYGAGDDLDVLRTFEGVGVNDRGAALQRTVTRLGTGRGLGARALAVVRTIGGLESSAALVAAQCEQASTLAGDLGLGANVVAALEQVFETFDGGGGPARLRGDAISLPARIFHVASMIEIQHRHRGRERAVATLRRESGVALDPELVDAILASPEDLWSVLEASSWWDEYQAWEPDPRSPCDIDVAARAFANFADLKSPIFLGHSTAVADLCDRAAAAEGLPLDTRAVLRRAALLHDLGIVAIPTGVWEKPGALDDAERDLARSHAFHGARLLARIPVLADEARIVGLHHERCDGSGYPMATSVGSSERAARILACADAYQGMVEERPHRPAWSPERAADELHRQAKAGALCSRALDGVLAVAGVRTKPSTRPPSGLTEREVAVLAHLARGLTNKEIAVALGIAPKTARNHVEHIYAKIGVTTRASAALFAVRHELISIAS
ncbi:MAG: HD domain-containing protein [Polyangiaceae bacterium]|nr:HD domain-containing protein [Polyangiaceae bacterium]